MLPALVTGFTTFVALAVAKMYHDAGYNPASWLFVLVSAGFAARFLIHTGVF